ncbi:protein sneaky isoform X1 [Drosophila santomea]|uniref:protein sneaky isoform X1 n=1 Tax=Drosophila santomea TaxID=129105 RepID=UPI001954010C|nr:protein sneaky isoform X1 [Drosophila santomea]
MYKRRNTIVSSEEETENCTGKRLINLYSRNYNSNLDLVESGKYRDSTSEGDAPIYPLNPPIDSEDPEPEDDLAEGYKKSLSECQNNALLYVIGGYIVGLLLVLMWYYRNPKEACKDLNGRWIFIVLVTLLIIILVRRRPARCIAVLCLSSLSSSQFRTLVIALAFLVAFSGPIKNIIHNICILANTLACGQNVLIQALKLMQRIINDPSHSVEEAFKTTLAQVCRLMNKLDKLLLNLERPIAQIHATYKTCTEWLLLQKDHYEYKMGTPYSRCMKAGNLSIAQCKREFGVKKKECCNLELFYWFCESLKTFKSFFDDNLQWSLMVIKEIFQRLQLCSMKIRYNFISTISFDHSLKFNSTGQFTPNKDHINEQDVNEKLEAQRQKLYFVLFLIDLIIFILLLAIIHQSLSFWLRYLSNEQYENVYITEAFENYDDKYYHTMGVRALPLSNFEENKYVKINSMRLLPKEYDTIYRSLTFLWITGIQLFCICFVDYSLYSMLTLMFYHGHMIEDVKPLAYKKIVIIGGGKTGDILRDLVRAFEPRTFKINNQRCLPVPGHPKYLRYVWIFLLYLLAWFMVFWEPYGLRQRHRTMMYFYPEESRRRVYDLHRIILHERKHLFKAKCREARFLNAFKNIHQFESYVTWIHPRLNWCLSCCTVSFIRRCCTICNKPLNKSDNVPCGWPNCRGIYCTTCSQDSHNKCVLCSSEYEDELLEHGNFSGNDSEICSVDNSYPQQRYKKI